MSLFLDVQMLNQSFNRFKLTHCFSGFQCNQLNEKARVSDFLVITSMQVAVENKEGFSVWFHDFMTPIILVTEVF